MNMRSIPKFSDVIAYLQGNIRYKIYHSRFWYGTWLARLLLPQRIVWQYYYRLEKMDKECYNRGSCKLCGCMTTKLQFANKACPRPCYPPMMSKEKWLEFIKPEIRKWQEIVKAEAKKTALK